MISAEGKGHRIYRKVQRGGEFFHSRPKIGKFLKEKYLKAEPLMTDDTTALRLSLGADDSDTALSE